MVDVRVGASGRGLHCRALATTAEKSSLVIRVPPGTAVHRVVNTRSA